MLLVWEFVGERRGFLVGVAIGKGDLGNVHREMQ